VASIASQPGDTLLSQMNQGRASQMLAAGEPPCVTESAVGPFTSPLFCPHLESRSVRDSLRLSHLLLKSSLFSYTDRLGGSSGDFGIS